MIARAIYQALTGNTDITSQLATYKETEGPAVFQTKAPEDMVGFPYLVFKTDEAESGGNHHWLRRTFTVEIHLWDLRSGYSTDRIDEITKRITVALDHQLLTDPDGELESARCWSRGRTVFDEPDEKDNIVHGILVFEVHAYRKFLAEALA